MGSSLAHEMGGLTVKIVSWNVNGIVSCRRKGFLKFLKDVKPDIVCCQEIKTKASLNTPGYIQFWNPAERPGYSGTLTLARQQPLSCTLGMGVEKFDTEGRLITLEYKDYYIVNAYVPSLNPHSAPDRPEYRLEWDNALRKYIAKLTKPVVLCGDFNATRAYIDSYPENQKNTPDDPLFQTEVRDGIEKLLSTGLVDAFRALHPQKEGAYTWWGPKNKNRADNRGSRLDYFFISGELLTFVQYVKFHVDVLGSDHCPISMVLNYVKPRHNLSDDDLAVLWRTIDWAKMEDELMRYQGKLAEAAFQRNWAAVERLQQALVRSWAARVLAVRVVVNSNAEIGVDGVRWITDAQKARAALSLTARGYHPLPYRHTEIQENDGKRRVIHVPAARDKAMLVLYAFALDPVAESTADGKSFSARKGRSALDAHAYLSRDLQGSEAPNFIVKVDVECYYGSIIHDYLIAIVPMDKTMLRKFLKAGVIKNGELFPTSQGISLGTSLSPILGNMLLDGLQSYIFDRLYPNGKADYLNGNSIRFADDITVMARSREQAEAIMQIVIEFLAERGLRINHEKSYIVDMATGFDFLSRHYQKKNGILYVTPSAGSVKKIERELEQLIMGFKGTQRSLIEKINDKLSGWGAYHRVEDSYMVFRHIDAVVEGLLVKKMCEKYPRWHRETILRKFWVKDGFNYVFILPTDPSVRVIRLAPLSIAAHKPCKLKFNPYLDQDYQVYLQYRRDVQKHSGRYKAIWNRQDGKCAYCKQPMLADQDVEIIEKEIGQGRRVQNLIYIHRQCMYDIFSDSDEGTGEALDLFAMLDGIMDDSPPNESPYLELTEYFRLAKKSPLTLTFREIEYILGDRLPWEAFFYDAFWYDDTEHTASMWQEEGLPFHIFRFSEPNYSIAHSWSSQGYQIKALHRESERVVFRKINKNISGVILPKALTEQQLPDEVVYKLNKVLKQFIKDNGL